ncbi:MAG TPA: sugar phosphate isomerase/epimerase family protein [Spirochaetia bacterium]|nr:sugar phosphate isomerase/epimerase family protein [Spirochaetia bacterium]
MSSANAGGDYGGGGDSDRAAPPVAISVVLISFAGTTEANLAAARDLGFRYVQLRNVGTDLTVDELTPRRREELLARLAADGLSISSLSGGYGRLADPGKAEERVEKERALGRLARDLGCRYVTGHIGSLDDSGWSHRADFLRCIGTWITELERDEIVFAVESGPEHGETLRELIDYFDSPCFRVNLDPANFLFYGFDLMSSCDALYDVSVHFHCKDAARRRSFDPNAQSSVADYPDAVHADEVAAGTGEVPFALILSELARRQVVRVAAVERESGSDRAADVRSAKALLEQYFDCGK